ncbi:transposase [Streptomyces sp. NBC_01390]|uniref:transposase n=1 Tax=Streptomyces sp. NBC_01390 TaxID=2903850 RepID=UPI00386851C8
MSVLVCAGEPDAFAELSRFRTAFYGCLSRRADAFFELADALLRADGPTRTPVELSLLAEHQRGYGSLYGALNHGRLHVVRKGETYVRTRHRRRPQASALLQGRPQPSAAGGAVVARSP